MTRINFTKDALRKLPSPDGSPKSYRDTNERGLSLYVTKAGTKTFFIRKRINGKDERIVLGPFPEMTVEMARRKALQTKVSIIEGGNPNEEKHNMRQEITFGELFDEYMERYSKKHKKSWKYDEREVNKFLSGWFNRKLSSITNQEVRKKRESVYEENGLYQANRLLERIRAIINKAIEWDWKGDNPALGIKKYKETARDRFVQPEEFPYLLTALETEENENISHYIWMLLLTGARKTNVLAMRWDEINWHRSEWKIPETKNGEPVTLPLSDLAVDMLTDIKKASNYDWVFPSPRDNKKHLSDPKRAWNKIRKTATILYWQTEPSFDAIIKSVEASIDDGIHVDVKFDLIVRKANLQGVTLPVGLMSLHLHDFRRTMGSYQAINGTSLPIIGKSLGHKSLKATEIYSRLNLDPVRASMEKATESMLALGRRGNK